MLKHLNSICKFPTVDTAVLVANTMANSPLDYCNSLLYGVSKGSVAKLQKVQNSIVCIVFRLDKMSHITPYIENSTGFLFKYNLLAFKAINVSQPPFGHP